MFDNSDLVSSKIDELLKGKEIPFKDSVFRIRRPKVLGLSEHLPISALNNFLMALTIGGSQDFLLDTSYNSVLRWNMAKVTMAIKIDEKVKNKLKELAEKEDRNLSNFVLRAVYTHVKEHHGVDLKK